MEKKSHKKIAIGRLTGKITSSKQQGENNSTLTPYSKGKYGIQEHFWTIGTFPHLEIDKERGDGTRRGVFLLSSGEPHRGSGRN